MKRIALSVLALLLCAVAAFAQTPAPADETSFHAIIEDQLQAFSTDDAARAYSHAAPLIQGMFPTPETFMAMVKQGYQPVYRSKSHQFGEAFTEPNGSPAQRVNLVGPDGKRYEATYTFERQPDGTWKISGCYLKELPGLDA